MKKSTMFVHIGALLLVKIVYKDTKKKLSTDHDKNNTHSLFYSESKTALVPLKLKNIYIPINTEKRRK